MRIVVRPNETFDIEGLARTALVQIDGDCATAAVMTGDVLGDRRSIGREVLFGGLQWVVTSHQPSQTVHSYTFRRITDG